MASMGTSNPNRSALSTGSWFPAATSLFPPAPDDCGRLEKILRRAAIRLDHAVSLRVTALHGVTCACMDPSEPTLRERLRRSPSRVATGWLLMGDPERSRLIQCS